MTFNQHALSISQGQTLAKSWYRDGPEVEFALSMSQSGKDVLGRRWGPHAFDLCCPLNKLAGAGGRVCPGGVGSQLGAPSSWSSEITLKGAWPVCFIMY